MYSTCTFTILCRGHLLQEKGERQFSPPLKKFCPSLKTVKLSYIKGSNVPGERRIASLLLDSNVHCTCGFKLFSVPITSLNHCSQPCLLRLHDQSITVEIQPLVVEILSPKPACRIHASLIHNIVGTDSTPVCKALSIKFYNFLTRSVYLHQNWLWLCFMPLGQCSVVFC